MSVSLLQVIEAGGYDLSTVEDARWLVSKQAEFERLVQDAELVVEEGEIVHSRHDYEHYKNCQSCYEDHLDFMEEQRIDEALDAAESEEL